MGPGVFRALQSGPTSTRTFCLASKCSSEQDSHPQVDLPGGGVVVVNRKRLQAAIFQREEQVRPRAVDHVAKHALVASKRGIAVTLGISKGAHIGGERVVLA